MVPFNYPSGLAEVKAKGFKIGKNMYLGSVNIKEPVHHLLENPYKVKIGVKPASINYFENFSNVTNIVSSEYLLNHNSLRWVTIKDFSKPPCNYEGQMPFFSRECFGRSIDRKGNHIFGYFFPDEYGKLFRLFYLYEDGNPMAPDKSTIQVLRCV